MPRITFTSSRGEQTTVDAPAGVTVMQAALNANLDGIVAECGGNAVCCTCHVYVDEAWLALLPPVSENEDALLDGAASPRQANSRLSCQLPMTPALDGLKVTIPPRQY